jgi:serine/threonine-protein phosphatase 6 regulatory subunit 3
MSDQNLIDSLVEKLNPKYSAEEHENVGQTLVEIITSNSHGCSILLEQLQSENVFRSLFASISESNCKSSLFWGLQVAIEVIRKDVYANSDSVPSYIRVCGDHLAALSKILTGHSSESLVTTIGQVVPVGTHRLKLVEFFSILLGRNYDVFDSLLLDFGVFEACLSMFFQYYWNNFLHSAVTDMVITFITTRSPEKCLRFISECTLVDRICEASLANDQDVSSPKGFSRGYIGFIDRISNKLNEIAEADSTGVIANYLKSHSGWRQYVESTLQKHNADASIVLGGQKPSADDVNQSSGDEEGPPAANEPVNVFSQYLVKQGFTNDFPKDFLADDDDEHDDEEADDLGNLAFDKIFDKLLGEPYRTDDSVCLFIYFVHCCGGLIDFFFLLGRGR